MSVTLNLCVIRVSDLGRTKQFYEALGILFTRERHGSGPEHLAAEFDGMVFELFPVGKGHVTTSVRLGFRVLSVVDSTAAVEQLGFDVLTAPADGLTGLRAVVVDTDGNRVELTQ